MKKPTHAAAIAARKITACPRRPIGIFEGHGDVGTNVMPDQRLYSRDGQYVISGAGYISGGYDEFQFVWKKCVATSSFTPGPIPRSWVNYHRKVGWMVRKSWMAIAMSMPGAWDGLTSLQFRRTEGARRKSINSRSPRPISFSWNVRVPIYHAGRRIWSAFQTDTISGIDLAMRYM